MCSEYNEFDDYNPNITINLHGNVISQIIFSAREDENAKYGFSKASFYISIYEGSDVVVCYEQAKKYNIQYPYFRKINRIFSALWAFLEANDGEYDVEKSLNLVRADANSQCNICIEESAFVANIVCPENGCHNKVCTEDLQTYLLNNDGNFKCFICKTSFVI